VTREQIAAWTALHDAALMFMSAEVGTPEHGDAEDLLTDAIDVSSDFLTREFANASS
jgi:hypothetical protein